MLYFTSNLKLIFKLKFGGSAIFFINSFFILLFFAFIFYNSIFKRIIFIWFLLIRLIFKRFTLYSVNFIYVRSHTFINYSKQLRRTEFNYFEKLLKIHNFYLQLLEANNKKKFKKWWQKPGVDHLCKSWETPLHSVLYTVQ